MPKPSICYRLQKGRQANAACWACRMAGSARGIGLPAFFCCLPEMARPWQWPLARPENAKTQIPASGRQERRRER